MVARLPVGPVQFVLLAERQTAASSPLIRLLLVSLQQEREKARKTAWEWEDEHFF